MPYPGERCHRAAAYATDCCRTKRRFEVGETFPPCPGGAASCKGRVAYWAPVHRGDSPPRRAPAGR